MKAPRRIRQARLRSLFLDALASGFVITCVYALYWSLRLAMGFWGPK